MKTINAIINRINEDGQCVVYDKNKRPVIITSYRAKAGIDIQFTAFYINGDNVVDFKFTANEDTIYHLYSLPH